MFALGLLLDVTLRAGPESVQMRVYLSPATLLVVPATLIGHWREQVLDLLCSVISIPSQCKPVTGLCSEQNCTCMETCILYADSDAHSRRSSEGPGPG